MAWHDEYPHSVFASVLLLDGKIESWKIGNPAKKSPMDFSAFWKLDRLEDYTSEFKEFVVNNSEEHEEVFHFLGHEWFRQWPIAENFHGSKPYLEEAKMLCKCKRPCKECSRPISDEHCPCRKTVCEGCNQEGGEKNETTTNSEP